MRPRKYQYPARFIPLDDGGNPPQMTPEVWREPPPVRRRRVSVAVFAPCLFFINQEAAPADTGEWRYQEPKVHARKRPQAPPSVFAPGHVEPGLLEPPQAQVQAFRKRRHQFPNALVEPIEAPAAPPANPDDGLETYEEPDLRVRRYPQHPPSVVRGDVEPGLLEPPQPQVQRLYRRPAIFPDSVVQPGHVEPGIIDFLFKVPEQPRRRRQPQQPVRIEPPFVAPPASPDSLEWLFRPPVQTWVHIQDKRRAVGAITGGVFDVVFVPAAPDPWRTKRPVRYRRGQQLRGVP